MKSLSALTLSATLAASLLLGGCASDQMKKDIADAKAMAESAQASADRAQKAAAERGKLSIGYDSDMGKFVGDSVLTSAIWNWGAYYTMTLKDALAGTWKTHEYWGGLKDGVVKLSSISPKVPANVVKEVEAAQKKILGGWSIFTGPLKGQDGKVVYPAGQVVPDAKQASMDWFVEGVVGKIQ